MLSLKSGLINLLVILLSTALIAFGIEVLILIAIFVCSFCFHFDAGMERVHMLVKSNASFFITFAMIYISVLLVKTGCLCNKFLGEKNA
ncbi:hypothetical protein N8865_02815 [Francisellaceae bacterium]|nr:hypothetical protein [Francisellaceae bacterium]